MGPVHTGTGPTAALGQAANPHLVVSIIRRKRLPRGLFGLPFWVFDCGRRSAARKATASAVVSGQRLVTFSLKALPCGSPGKTSRRTLHSTILLPAQISSSEGREEQAVSNEWKRRSRIANSELLGSRNWCPSGETNCIDIGATELCGYAPSCRCRTGDEKRY